VCLSVCLSVCVLMRVMVMLVDVYKTQAGGMSASGPGFLSLIGMSIVEIAVTKAVQGFFWFY